MTNFIPIFPLALTVFPGENLNLHIFEPRYKQLITDCFTESKPFGIPSILKTGIGERGTLLNILEIVQVYEDGKLDIRTIGVSVFKILELVKIVPDKLYSGAIVSHLENTNNKNELLLSKVLLNLRELHVALNLTKDFKKPDSELLSFDIAHHVGMSLEEEYLFLGMLREDQRLEYLNRHLKKVLPVVNEMEQLKHRIKLNGHFKNLSGNFNL